MKKHLCLLFAVLLLFAMCACGEQEMPHNPDDTGGDEVISKGKGFEITLHRTETSSKYYYTVTANDGTVIEHASAAEQPKVAPLGENLLGIRFYTETNSWCRYYDLESGKASESFFRAFWDNGKLVAYNDYEVSGKLIVRDIFDSSGYRFEQAVESSALELTVSAAVPSDDGSVLTVEYILGQSGDRNTVDIPLK